MVSCLQLCTLTLWNLTYRIYCRYKGKGWTPSKPLGIWCSCQTQAYGHKKGYNQQTTIGKGYGSNPQQGECCVC